MGVVLGIDVGGTFTDLISYDIQTESVNIEKVPSTPDDPSIGVINGIEKIGVQPAEISLIVHGTTVTTNAAIEREGAPCGLLVTKGFQDVLELGWRDRPNLWGLEGEYEPLIPRTRAMGIEERTDANGEILTEVEPASVKEAGKELLEKDVEAVVVSFLNAHENPQNERDAVSTLEEIWPNEYIVPSSTVLSEYRHFERTSTAALTAYTQPTIASYLDKLRERLREANVPDDILIMQANGGMAHPEVTKVRSAHTMLSGPAAGVTAASRIAKMTGNNNVISCDMGGTSFDVSILPNGKPQLTQETELEYQLPVRVPMVDITAIGAGGGSIAELDEGGIIHTGPESAGADPGPVCYGLGSTQITITDANLVLKRINPDRPIGENIDLDIEAARNQIRQDIADPLEITFEEAANAIIDVGISKIVGEIRKLSVDSGYDPREFSLVVFGGAGPLHAGEIIANSDLSRAIIPSYPGILSAMGCILANIRHDQVETVGQSLDEFDIGDFQNQIEKLENEGRDLLADHDVSLSGIEAEYQCNMSYTGQTHTVTVPFDSSEPTRNDLRKNFREVYLEKYSQAVDSPIRIENLQVSVVGLTESINLEKTVRDVETTAEDAKRGSREIYYDGKWSESPIYERRELPHGATIDGPAVIEQADTTTLVNPGLECRIDRYGNAILEEKQ